MTKLIARLAEPSTYAGLSGITLVIAGITPEDFQMWVGAVAGVFAFVSIILKEVGSPE